MNDNPIVIMYDKLRTKWDTPTKPWHELDPQRQIMFMQAFNLIINAMNGQ